MVPSIEYSTIHRARRYTLESVTSLLTNALDASFVHSRANPLLIISLFQKSVRGLY